jgi:hypothetical protein
VSKPTSQAVSAEKLREICSRLEQELKGDPNVLGVGIGPHIVEGERRGMAVQVSVRVIPRSEEEARRLGAKPVPREIEGVPIELIEPGVARPDSAPTGQRGGRQENPLVGGTSTTVLSSFHSFPTGYGTLGGICFDSATGNAMAISNAHVWGHETGRTVIQPWMPVDEYVEAVIKLIACGPVISYLVDWTAPSPLTGILAAGAAGAWVAAVASDDPDPSRWGQDQTPVSGVASTTVERVGLSAKVPENPMPGYPYVAPTSWSYTRFYSGGEQTAAVEQEPRNAHVAVKKVITDRQQYHGGERVRICAEILGFRARQARDYFVVARCFPLGDPDRLVTRVLRPGDCDIKRPGEWECFGHFPREWIDAQLAFPLHFGVYRFSGNADPQVRLIQVANQAGAQIALRIPHDGAITVDLLPTTRVRIDVSHTSRPVTVFARDPMGRVVAQQTSSETQSHRETLELTGDLIQSLTVFGSGGEGWIHGICVFRPDLPDRCKLPDSFRAFTFVGELDLALREPAERWGIIVTVQTVDNSPPRTQPVEAAANIGGLMTAPVTAQLAGCVTVMLLDHVFDVI